MASIISTINEWKSRAKQNAEEQANLDEKTAEFMQSIAPMKNIIEKNRLEIEHLKSQKYIARLNDFVQEWAKLIGVDQTDIEVEFHNNIMPIDSYEQAQEFLQENLNNQFGFYLVARSKTLGSQVVISNEFDLSQIQYDGKRFVDHLQLTPDKYDRGKFEFDVDSYEDIVFAYTLDRLLKQKGDKIEPNCIASLAIIKAVENAQKKLDNQDVNE